MAVEKRLAFSIVQFLRDQTHGGSLNSDEQESLEGGSAALTGGLALSDATSFSNHCKESAAAAACCGRTENQA